MGLAIFVPDINFSGLGKVTLTGDTAPASIAIDALDSYNSASVQLSVKYSPMNVALRGITWSIVSGGDYASIDNNGKMTINNDASGVDVTVRAVSQADGAVFDEKTITVTYANPVTILEKVTVQYNPTLNTGLRLVDDLDTIEMKYRITDAPVSSNGMLWGCLDERSSFYLSGMVYAISVFGADREHGHTIGTGAQYTYRTPTTVGELYVDEYSMTGYSRNGEPAERYGNSQVGDGFTPSDDIYILHPLYDYSFAGIEIYYFKFKRNGIVTHSFMPAVKDGVYGFYDTNTDTFITNTGDSGTITA